MSYIKSLVKALPKVMWVDYKNPLSEGQTIINKEEVIIEDDQAVFYDATGRNVLDLKPGSAQEILTDAEIAAQLEAERKEDQRKWLAKQKEK